MLSLLRKAKYIGDYEEEYGKKLKVKFPHPKEKKNPCF